MAESQAVQLFVQLLRTQWRWSGAGQRWSLTAQSQAYKRHHREPTGEPAEQVEPVREIGVSRRHFFRAFKQSTGKTPHSYVAEHRLKRADDLLRTTDFSATDIALGCGFASSSHFTVAFKQAEAPARRSSAAGGAVDAHVQIFWHHFESPAQIRKHDGRKLPLIFP